MSYKIQFENSMQQTKSYENLYLNPLELVLRRNPQFADYAFKFIDIYPVYCLKEQKYICYRRILKRKQQHLMIQEHINSSTYEWKENVYHNTISLYHFMSIRKNEEQTALWGLNSATANSYLWWKIWGVLEDGTILSPAETRKIIKLLQNNVVESNPNNSYPVESSEDYEARKTYLDYFAEGDFDEL